MLLSGLSMTIVHLQIFFFFREMGFLVVWYLHFYSLKIIEKLGK